MRSVERGERALAQRLLESDPAAAARILETCPDADTAALLEREPLRRALAVVQELTADRAARVASFMDRAAATRVLSALEPARAAALTARLDPEERERVLEGLDEGLARELRELAAYPEHTAGRLMDPRVTSFRPDATVRDAVRRLRRFRTRRVQDVFLVGADGKLLGSVSLQALVLAPSDTPLEALARIPCPAVASLAPREEVVEVLERHGVASLAVVDAHGRLVGVLRQEELLAAAQEEAHADAVTMVGASAAERALSPPLFAVRKRLPWLQVNLLTAFLAAAVVGLFESAIAQVTALAVLLPVVAGQSGNTGAQALAVTMRGLALREVRVRQWIRVAGKELLVGAANGVAVALTTALAVWVWSRSTGLALVIGVSMVVSMTLAGLSGAVIPMALTAIRQDPAQSSSIILTTVTDVTGFFSFLGIATLLMALLPRG